MKCRKYSTKLCKIKRNFQISRPEKFGQGIRSAFTKPVINQLDEQIFPTKLEKLTLVRRGRVEEGEIVTML